MRLPEAPPDSPAALIARIAQGDREAFGRFYDALAPLAFGLIRRLLPDRDSAADVLQDVFWEIWREAPRYDPRRGSPEAWVTVRARARAIDQLRAVRRRDRVIAPMPEGLEIGQPSAENPAEAAAERGLLNAALSELPEAQRRVIELAFFDGLSHSEIAVRLGEPLGTVKSRMRLGMERLRSALQGEKPRT
jgi:RNA polymerase sigma-70 factor (ECF subfamily)